MRETQETEVKEAPAQELPAPQGIGMAVAIDWGLVVQMLLLPVVALVRPGQSMLSGAASPVIGIVVVVFSLLSAAVLAWFGEMVRSGHNWARWVQIVGSSLLTLGGLFSLINLYHSVTSGNFWPVITEIILLIFSPLIVWRLTRPATATWFKNVTTADARKRHGGSWIWFIALFALIGGILQVLAASMK